MDEQKTNHLKNLVLIMMGMIVSFAGIIYIVVQYTKLLTDLLTKKADGDEEEIERFNKKVQNRFPQMEKDEGVSPDTLEEDDITVEIAE